MSKNNAGGQDSKDGKNVLLVVALKMVMKVILKMVMKIMLIMVIRISDFDKNDEDKDGKAEDNGRNENDTNDCVDKQWIQLYRLNYNDIGDSADGCNKIKL